MAVPVPALEALTYAVPDEHPEPAVGARVLVPVGNRVVTGIVIERGGAEAPGPDRDAGEQGERKSIKPIIDLLDDQPFLPPDVVALTKWVADYYACGMGDAIGAAMPPHAWIESERYAQITDAGHGRLLLERGGRRDILQQLIGDRPVSVETLAGQRRGGQAALGALERDGLIAVTRPLVGKASAFRTVRVVHLTAQGSDVAAERDLAAGADPRAAAPAATPISARELKLGPRQREALTMLAGAPEGLDSAALASRGIAASALARLAALGLITFTRRRIERDPFDLAAAPVAILAARPAVVLTEEQRAALDVLNALAARRAFATAVLYGVTGSGKTEIYLHAARAVVQAGSGVLVLVPEIALTPAVVGAFRTWFGERVAIQHSGLSDGERHDQWHRIRRGEVDVVVGTRSAVFAPVRRLGLIVVDEEHDSSYKQEETPRYHGRDVAVMRGHDADALVILGSATPSLESFHNALGGRYVLVPLERRVLDRPMAHVRLVDMRDEYAEHGPEVVISATLTEAIAARLERREQSMVLLNRRGFATSLFCRQCGATLDCPNCSVTLTVHRAARRARCHYCNFATAIPKRCAQCAGSFLEQAGFGTERVEAELAALFPAARISRVDRDTVRRRGAITALLARFATGQIDVLVGTQMIAKGHDFPRVTLVGVVSADVGLGLADFRAGERTFQLLTQVAGRAGRGEIAGEVIVQTIHPTHYSIQHACAQDYRAFYEREVGFRRAMRYPPALAMINAIVKAPTLDRALHEAGEIVAALRRGAGSVYRVLGPAPAPLSRLKGEHRAQFFLKGARRSAMRQALAAALNSRPEIRRRTVVDVDPVSVL